MNTATEYPRATSIAWDNAGVGDGFVSRPPHAYDEQRIIESAARPHAVAQREAEAEAQRKREADAKRRGVPVEEPRSPNCRLAKGEFFQGSRDYTSADGPFYCKADIVFFMALANPVPGSKMEEFSRRGVKNLPVLEPLRPLSQDERDRLDRLRESPYELSEAQIADRREADRRTRAFLLEQLVKLPELHD
jgi:hypothetical protein